MLTPLTLLALLAPPLDPPGQDAAPDPAEVSIVVARAAADPEWRLTYSLATPVERLVFQRSTNHFRHATWVALTDGIELSVEDGSEVIRSTTGEPFSAAEFAFATNNEHLDRDYEFHVPFTDGGVLLYTGHLAVRSGSRSLRTELVLTGRPGDQVLHAGVRQASWTIVTDGEGDGAYVYFGAAQPVETDDVISILDPGLPDWMRAGTEHYLPLLFALYTERLGLRLPARPMVYFSYVRGEPGSTTFSGGALEGMIQLTFIGQGGDGPGDTDDDLFVRLIEFLAHESVHLWNGQLVSSDPDPAAAWMHEGSADALALRATHALGVIDRDGLYQRYTAAANRAAAGLDGSSVLESHELSRFRNAYDAGSTLALVTEAAVLARDRDTDLFDFWRELLQTTRAGSGTYTQHDYFALCDQLAPESGVGTALREFVGRRHEDPAAALMDLFMPYDEFFATLSFETGELILTPGEQTR